MMIGRDIVDVHVIDPRTDFSWELGRKKWAQGWDSLPTTSI